VKDTKYPLYSRLRGPQWLSRLVQKISPQPGFDSRNDQPLESRYTYWAIPAQLLHYYALSNGTKYQHFKRGGGRLLPSSSITYSKDCGTTPIPYVNVYQFTWRHTPYDWNVQQQRYRNVKSFYMTDRLSELRFVSFFGSFNTFVDCTKFTALQHRLIRTNPSVQFPSIEVWLSAYNCPEFTMRTDGKNFVIWKNLEAHCWS